MVDHATAGGKCVCITSDASGSWGCGAYSETGVWFQLPWSGTWRDAHITCKELLPIVVVCAVWGRQWKGKTLYCRTDNAAVVGIVRSGTSKNELAMHLVHCMSFFTARFQLRVVAAHIPGSKNVAADALSRNRLSVFRLQVPNARPEATMVPQELWDMLVTRRPDWTSQTWSEQFSTILQKV